MCVYALMVQHGPEPDFNPPEMEGLIATAMAGSTPVYWPLAFRSY